MRIKKMLLLAGMALTAIAFAVPAVAQSSVRLTDLSTKTLPLNSLITTTSTDFQTKTSAGTVTCQLVTLHYRLIANGPNHVRLEPTATHNGTFEKCHLTTEPAHGAVHPTHISSAGTGELTINTWGTGETSVTYTSLITLPSVTLHCVATGTVHVQGVASGSNVVNVGPSVLSKAGIPCPPTGTISGTSALETSAGKEVRLHFVKTF